MIQTITLRVGIIQEARKGTVDFDLNMNVTSSPFCPRDGKHKGYLVLPLKGCRHEHYPLNDSFSMSFTVKDHISEKNYSDILVITDIKVFRHSAIQSGMNAQEILDLLIKNGWRCRKLAKK